MLKVSYPLIQYDAITTIEKVGTLPIHLLAIRDLDQALTKICDHYETKTPEEENELLDLCPYFGVIWPSARALATFMSERKTLFTKKKGIEVGAGLALPTLAACKMGAQMIATDFHPDVRYFVEKNAELNQVRIHYQEWDWTNAAPHAGIEPGTYDFVLASDVLYEGRHPEALAQAMARLVSPTGSIYLSDPGRAYLKSALSELKNLGFDSSEFEFEVEESSSLPEHRLEKKRKIFVYELRRTK